MEDKVILGRFGTVYGVQAWIKVHSFTQPITNILNYPEWQVQHLGVWETVNIEDGRIHGKGVVVKMQNIDDREQAQAYANDLIAIDPKALPTLEEDEYYWRDLIGMSVITKDNIPLGTVKNLLETGSNDVLIVKEGKRERLIPYTQQVVQSIDSEKKIIIVDWDPEF